MKEKQEGGKDGGTRRSERIEKQEGMKGWKNKKE